MSDLSLVPTTVNPHGLSELIRNLGRDCLPTQFIREFTKNAFEACQRTGEADCKVIVDYDREAYDKSLEKVWKVCFIDTGDGMSAGQMEHLLNSLSASGESKNEHKNYGVGAKIAALTRNHAGIIYDSWQGGQGHRVVIRYDEKRDIYGIQRVEIDGEYLACVPLSKCSSPDIRAKGHGTKVTLFGMSSDQDTMAPPENVGGIRESWLVLYLNSRFFSVPSGVSLHARIGYYRDNNPRHNYLFHVHGQKMNLDRAAELKGVRHLAGAKLFWWVMPKNADGHGRELLKGHTAMVNQGEIFDISDGRSNRVTFFGVVHGRDRVVIYLEPEEAHQNTARTALVKADGSPILWHDWSDEFRNDIPLELKEWLRQQELEYATESHSENIKERLKNLKSLFKLGRYKVHPQGQVDANPDSNSAFSTSHLREGDPQDESPNSCLKSPGEKPGDLLSDLLSEVVAEGTGIKANEVTPDPFPKLQWVSASQGYEHLTDRAAEYLRAQHLVVANKEFQGVIDLVEYLSKGYADLPEVRQFIVGEVHQAFEQALMECVAGALSFKNRKHWDTTQAESAVSSEALTTAVMPRYWMVSHIKRILSGKIKAHAVSDE